MFQKNKTTHLPVSEVSVCVNLPGCGFPSLPSGGKSWSGEGKIVLRANDMETGVQVLYLLVSSQLCSHKRTMAIGIDRFPEALCRLTTG